jgi:hypothetical protein
MNLGWAWLLLLLATYPWLLGVDLLGDALASTGIGLCAAGVAIIAPCRRLRRWQAVLFAASVGFLFEALRPIPDGAVALPMVAAAIHLTSHRDELRDLPRMFRGAVLVNALACTAWFLATSFAHSQQVPLLSLHFAGQYLLHLLVATGLAVLLLAPLALSQDYAMDKLGVPRADEAA